VEDLPDLFQLLTVDVSDDVVFDTIEPAKLPHQWRFDPATTQTIGDDWLTANQIALLRVPSAIVPFAWNWLLNPTHRDTARSQIIDTRRVAFDARLFR
jgi:RES domain-containing protein